MHYFPKIGIFKFIMLFILSMVMSVLFAVPYTVRVEMNGGTANSSAILIFLSSLGLYLGILVFIWWLSLTKTDRARIWEPAPARSPGHIGFILAPFLLSLPVNIIYVLFLERFMPDFLEKMMEAGNLPENILGSMEPLSLFLLFLSVVVMAPIVEEIAFRGVLYNLLGKRMPLIAAAIISSIVFGLMHGTTFLQTAVIGFVLAFIYQVTGNLKIAILGHAANNGIALGQGILLAKGIIKEGEASETVFGGVMLVLAIIMLVATVKYLRKNSFQSVFKDSAPMYKQEIFEQHKLEQKRLEQMRFNEEQKLLRDNEFSS